MLHEIGEKTFKTDAIYLEKVTNFLKSNPSKVKQFQDALAKAKNKAQFIDELHPQNLLVLGDLTFEYSRTLRNQSQKDGLLGNQYSITATGYESQQEVVKLLEKVKDPSLKNMPTNQPNYTVIHGVDATKLSARFQGGQFDKIVFNNPELKIGAQDLTEQLLEGVVKDVPNVLKKGGELHIGVTGSGQAKGSTLLDRYLGRGNITIGGRQVSVRRIDRRTTPIRFSAEYAARRTTGGGLRGSKGPTYYYIFRLLD